MTDEMQSLEADIVDVVLAAIREALPADVSDEVVTVVSGVTVGIVEMFQANANRLLTGYADLFEQQAKDRPLSRATPGLLMAAQSLRAAVADVSKEST